MSARRMHRTVWSSFAAAALIVAWSTHARAQKVNEDFNDASGSGGGVFFDGQGYDDTGGAGWDDQLGGENAFGLTFGNVHATMSAEGDPTAGTAGSGAGKLTVSNINLNLIDQDFRNVSATGGSAFLTGDGSSNTLGVSENWDFGIVGESAFAQTTGGAILVGDVSAEGCLDCGVGGGAASQLVVDNVMLNGGSWDAELIFAVPGFAFGSGPLLFNRSFERDGGSLAPWVADGNADYGTVTPRSGAHSVKMFGTFTGLPNFSTLYQEVAAAEGQTWRLSAWVRHNDTTGDPLGDYLRSGSHVNMKIGFYDASDALISTTGVRIIDEFDPRDVYLSAGPIAAVAPAATASARAIFQFSQPDGAAPGAAVIDDVEFELVGADLSAFYNQFNLSAQVKGVAIPANGEVLGTYQLRLQDPEGNALVFSQLANGAFQSIGGPLGLADERNAAGMSSNGAFDAAADSFVAVVAFDNAASAWGTGGALTVDDLVLTNSYESPGDSYVAALIWDELLNLGADRINKLLLTADIKGSVPGGAYQLRVEGFNAIPCLNEDFESITSNSETQVAAPGGGGGAVANWNDELAYEQGVFGLEGGVVTSTGGAWIRGRPDGGVGNSACAEIEVIDVGPDPDGVWWAGIYWQNQTLGTTDLGAISLTADIRGEWNPDFLQFPPRYTLRIEDAQGDYLGFDGILPDTAFHSIGGLLSDATTNGTVAGGDGIFDVSTTGTYTVIVLFAGLGSNVEPPFGNWGGKLIVDNVGLSPCGEPALQQAGSVAFDRVANGSFQSVGGLLSVADVSTFFGVGGVFWNNNPFATGGLEWDAGIEGEQAFAGFWGAGHITGQVSAQGCTDCGTNGTGGGWYQWSGSGTAGSGGWWAGVNWPVTATFTNLNQVRLVGAFRAEWNEANGEAPGNIYFKLESSPNNQREFRIPASATSNGWYHVDSTLDLSSPVGNLLFGTERTYQFVISTFGIDANGDWGSGGTVYFDNLKLIVNGQTLLEEDFETAIGPRLPGLRNSENRMLDAYTVVVAMEEGAPTWGLGGGTLTVDNLRLALAASCDGDDDIDLVDFALFQACFGGDGSGDCECADGNADGIVDLADAALFSLFLEGP